METKETSGLDNGHPPKVYTTFEELEKIKIKLEQRKKNGKKNNLVLFAYKNAIWSSSVLILIILCSGWAG